MPHWNRFVVVDKIASMQEGEKQAAFLTAVAKMSRFYQHFSCGQKQSR